MAGFSTHGVIKAEDCIPLGNETNCVGSVIVDMYKLKCSLQQWGQLGGALCEGSR